MKSIFSLLLLVFFIQSSLASTDYDITIIGLGETIYDGCKSDNQVPYFGFSLNVFAIGFKEVTEWKINVGRLAYANCEVYPKEEMQTIVCAIDVNLFPLKSVKFPPIYSHFDQRYYWTVTGWEKIANKEIFANFCYPKYFYSFVPSTKTQHLVECDYAGNNKVTIFGKFDMAQFKNLRRLSTDSFEFSPILIVDGLYAKANCLISPDFTQNSSEDAMVCVMNGRKYFQFFATTAIEYNEQSRILIEDSNKLALINC